MVVVVEEDTPKSTRSAIPPLLQRLLRFSSP